VMVFGRYWCVARNASLEPFAKFFSNQLVKEKNGHIIQYS
jgi:hypothetical protein